MQAAARRAEREAERERKRLAKEIAQLEKLAEIEQVAHEVEVHENRIAALLSVHKQVSEPIDWKKVFDELPPEKPENGHVREERAKKTLATYRPSLIDKIFFLENSRRQGMQADIEAGRNEDEKEFRLALSTYDAENEEWEQEHAIADGILKADCRAFIEAIKVLDPFSDIAALGSKITFATSEPWYMEAELDINDEQSVPQEEKSQLKSGKLSARKMPRRKFLELYQDYVCSCVLRVSRELTALLPVETVFVHAVGQVLDTKTGHLDKVPILSVMVPRNTLARLNFDRIDCSDAMVNFKHHMEFRKTKGFAPVQKLIPADFRPAQA